MNKEINNFIQRCRDVNMRVTPQRIAIFEALLNRYDHPNAELIYTELKPHNPGLSKDTVYRTLHTLKDLGLLTTVHMASDHTHFDSNTKPHIHFICLSCNAITDVYHTIEEPPESISSIGEVQSTYVEMRGICNKCKKKEEK